MEKEIKKAISKAIFRLQQEKTWPIFELEEIQVDHPSEDKFGDYTSNIALLLAKKISKSPMEIAEELKTQSSKFKTEELEKIEVVTPGYINFYLSKKYLQNKVLEINKIGESYGKSEIGKGRKVNNEFISANPTGPLTVGNGRGGFCGDSLSRVLKKAGFEVVNEYYVNDTGEQIIKLGHSVLKDSEAVYGGDYIAELNEKYKDISGAREVGQPASLREALLAGEKAAKDILENIIQKTVKEKMRISFDNWTSEKKIQEDGDVDRAINLLKDKKLTYTKDGALWLKTKEFGDDKDRVLVKSNGKKAYFASDCGYILNKIERRFNKIIEIWGADHHGYISRFQAAAKALGFNGELKFIIVQLVRLVKGGQEVRMSKRSGNVVYIDELIDKVEHDVARFFFLMYSPDTHMNFDLSLAEERSQKNPVFYVQYAHARICSVLKKAADLKNGNSDPAEDLSGLQHEKELSLIKELNKFPELIEEIARGYAVHKMPHYAIKLADKFHSFYNDLKVIDEENWEVSRARLKLINAVKIVLAETLRLIGVKAPERM